MDQELVEYLNERFAGVDRQFEELRGEMRDGQEEVKRHTGILVEDLRYQVQLVAESLAIHVEAETGRHQAIQEQFRETHALIRLSFDSLRQQDDQIRQRLGNLERKSQG